VIYLERALGQLKGQERAAFWQKMVIPDTRRKDGALYPLLPSPEFGRLVGHLSRL
jgi:hypothetical protein